MINDFGLLHDYILKMYIVLMENSERNIIFKNFIKEKQRIIKLNDSENNFLGWLDQILEKFVELYTNDKILNTKICFSGVNSIHYYDPELWKSDYTEAPKHCISEFKQINFPKYTKDTTSIYRWDHAPSFDLIDFFLY